MLSFQGVLLLYCTSCCGMQAAAGVKKKETFVVFDGAGPVVDWQSLVQPRQADELVRVSLRCIFHCFFLGRITSLPFSEAVRKFESRMPKLCCFVLVRPLTDPWMHFTFKPNLFGCSHITPHYSSLSDFSSSGDPPHGGSSPRTRQRGRFRNGLLDRIGILSL